MEKWVLVSWETLVLSLLSLTIVYGAIIALTRLVGLRSFSKMSAPDFAVTVAIGSVLASTATASKPPILQAIVVFGGLFFLQWLLAYLRRKNTAFADTIDNAPLLLMEGTEILDGNLEHANVTREDLLAKLREANVLNFLQIRAVVFESTGDISVLHTSGDETLDLEILDSVRSKP